MTIMNVPECIANIKSRNNDLMVYDFKMSSHVFKSKVNLSMHMFSFMQKGRKHVYFADSTVSISYEQSILAKRGNSLWSEMIDKGNEYYCKLLFFSNTLLKEFIAKHELTKNGEKPTASYMVIDNDDYIHAYLSSINLMQAQASINYDLFRIKFEELMMYLLQKYGSSFESFLLSIVTEEPSTFQQIIETNKYAPITMEEIAFLCNMSLSTFKRRFVKEYNESPGKWLQDKRLQRAKRMIENGNSTPSDIYADLGYKNLSNFSAAFKKKFGVSPSSLRS